MKLSDILKDVETSSIHGSVDRAIHALQYDSRKVEANDVFFAWKGVKTDGHSYIAEVCDKGAAAVVLEVNGGTAAKNHLHTGDVLDF